MPFAGFGRFSRGQPQASLNGNDGTPKNASDQTATNDPTAPDDSSAWMNFDQQLDFSYGGDDSYDPSLDAYDLSLDGDVTMDATQQEQPQKNQTPSSTNGSSGLSMFKQKAPVIVQDLQTPKETSQGTAVPVAAMAQTESRPVETTQFSVEATGQNNISTSQPSLGLSLFSQGRSHASMNDPANGKLTGGTNGPSMFTDGGHSEGYPPELATPRPHSDSINPEIEETANDSSQVDKVSHTVVQVNKGSRNVFQDNHNAGHQKNQPSDQGYSNAHSTSQENDSMARVLPMPSTIPNQRGASTNTQSFTMEENIRTPLPNRRGGDGKEVTASIQTPRGFSGLPALNSLEVEEPSPRLQNTNNPIQTPVQAPKQHAHCMLPAVTPSPSALPRGGGAMVNPTPPPTINARNQAESPSDDFDDLKARFLSDIRDIQDVQNDNASLLLQIESLFATAYSESLHDQANFLDLLEQLEALESKADATIARFRNP